MTPQQYERVRTIFLDARAQPSDSRAAYLREACGEDGFILAEVESLLASDERAETFLNTPALGSSFAVGRPESLAPTVAGGSSGGPALGHTASSSDYPPYVGQYRVLGVLGRGGMGVVYRAEQENPRRAVALKVTRPGVESAEALRRFEHEGHVLGWLQHPGIAQVFEAGTADTGHGPQPFFAMEFIEGQSLTDYVRTQNLDVRRRLELIAKVCDAVHHAHQKGVIHRDLKPQNILVNDAGQPKVLDFGVARATDADLQAATLETAVGQVLGTIRYMSPEQVAGDPSELDTRSDVYSLGVILYELLTGRLPVDVSNRSLPEAARAITEDEPESLSSIDRLLRGDVETIVAKALEKNKTRRYQSASDLAADIRRYLSDQPITARPATALYQLRKFARRNRGLVAGLVGIAAVLVLGTVVSTSLAVWALGAERLAQQRFTQAEDARELAEQRRAEATDALAQATTETVRARAVRDFLLRMLGFVDPELAQGRDDALLRAVLDEAADDIQAELGEYPDVQATIHQVIGTVYRDISRYDQAEYHLLAAHELYTQVLGEDAPETLAAFGDLAQLRWNQAHLDEAAEMYDELIGSYEQTLGATHRKTLMARYDRAGVWRDRGESDEAETELRDLLETMRAHLDADDGVLFDATNGLALLARGRGQAEEAAQLMRPVVAHWTEQDGPRHPKRIRALGNLASIVADCGDLEEAEALSRESLALRREVFGEVHHSTIQAEINLADLLREQGEFAEAADLARTALEKAARVLGPEHPDTLKATSHLGISLRNLGEYEEAQVHLESAVALSERLHGAHDPRTLNRLSSLAGLLYEQRKLEEAEAIMRRVVDGLRAVHGERSPSTLAAIINLAMLLVEREKLDEAEQMLQTVIKLVDEAAPPGHWYRWTARVPYAKCLLAMERYDEAEALLLECFTGLSESLGPQHHRTRGAAAELVKLYEASGRPEDAAQYAEPASEPTAPPAAPPQPTDAHAP